MDDLNQKASTMGQAMYAAAQAQQQSAGSAGEPTVAPSDGAPSERDAGVGVAQIVGDENKDNQ